MHHNPQAHYSRPTNHNTASSYNNSAAQNPYRPGHEKNTQPPSYNVQSFLEKIATLEAKTLQQQREIVRLKEEQEHASVHNNPYNPRHIDIRVASVAGVYNQLDQANLENQRLKESVHWLLNENTRINIHNAQLTAMLAGMSPTYNSHNEPWGAQQNLNQDATTTASSSSPPGTLLSEYCPPASHWQAPLAATTSGSLSSFARLLDSWEMRSNTNDSNTQSKG